MELIYYLINYMSDKIFFFEDIGEVLFKKSLKARRLRITIKPSETVKVTVPLFVSISRAKNLVLERKEWIKQNLLKLKVSFEPRAIFDENMQFQTKNHTLKIKRSGKNLYSRITDSLISVNIPAALDIKHNEAQQHIRRTIERAFKKEAVEVIPKRVSQLAKTYGFKYNKITIRNAKTRWGSCSGQNNISLSLHLMRLPEELSDYIILHELLHTKVKNHGRRFWSELEKICPNAKELRKKLRQFRIQIW